MSPRDLVLAIMMSLLLLGCGGGGGTSDGSDLEDELTQDYLSPTIPTGDTTIIAAPSSQRKVPMLVIQIEYIENTFTHNALTWSNRLFGSDQGGDGYNRLNAYFEEVSYGQFTFSRAEESDGTPDDGVITVRLNKVHPDSGSGESIHSDLRLAMLKADEAIDFRQYDDLGDHDGAITPDELTIIFIIAGYEEAYDSSDHPSVWAHQSCVNAENTPTLDGVSLMGCERDGDYALFGERHHDHDATIGIIAHELSHSTFDLPDLYDTVDSDYSGIGYFGLMGYGSWGHTYDDIHDGSTLYGNTPVHLTAWSKLRNGWVTPLDITSATDVTLYESASTQYNVVKIEHTSKEYFLLENRHDDGFDRGLYGLNGLFAGGMAIWHIDEAVIDANYESNQVNNDQAHKGVDIEEAAEPNIDTGYIDKSEPGLGHEKNLFYLGNAQTFDDASLPSSKSYDGSSTAIAITEISARDTFMTAKVTKAGVE